MPSTANKEYFPWLEIRSRTKASTKLSSVKGCPKRAPPKSLMLANPPAAKADASPIKQVVVHHGKKNGSFRRYASLAFRSRRFVSASLKRIGLGVCAKADEVAGDREAGHRKGGREAGRPCSS